jgi:hypothetical protein
MIAAFRKNKNLHEIVFKIILYISWILYAFSLFAYAGLDLEWLSILIRESIKIYVGLFLVIKYNPISKTQTFTQFDREIAFHAGFFILVTSIINTILENSVGYILHT